MIENLQHKPHSCMWRDISYNLYQFKKKRIECPPLTRVALYCWNVVAKRHIHARFGSGFVETKTLLSDDISLWLCI